MNLKFANLPALRRDELIFQDTSGAPLPGKIVPCLMCCKPFLMRPYVGTPDQICGECYTTYHESAKVVCRSCQVTICRVVPKVLDSGYYIRPRTVLHSSACNCCRPGLQQSTIVEIEQWERTMRPRKIIVGPNRGSEMTLTAG